MGKALKNVIGRKQEIHLLKQILERNEAQLVAVYGRRRVGKTFLVKSFFDNEFDFSFTGSYKTATNVQLALFAQALHEYSGSPEMSFKNWFQAFTALRDYLKGLKKDQIVVFLDEIPWMDQAKSNFLAAFSQFWNSWGSTCHGLKLVVCGSATTWMLDKFVGDKGGFYGRSNRSIYLAPFTLNETEAFLDMRGVQLNRYMILKLYMIVGGIPYYLDMIDPGLPFDLNIDTLFFSMNAPLRTEYDFLFRTLFGETQLYRKIVELLARNEKGLTQNDIKDALKLGNGGTLSKVMLNLQKCDFVRVYNTFGKKKNSVMYQLTDLFTLFHLHFVQYGNGQDEHFWSNLDDHHKESWEGHAFEMVCLHHIPQIKEKLGIRGVLTNACSWQTKPLVDSDGTNWSGAQIDLLLDRADNVVNVCEMKFSKDEYVLTEAYSRNFVQKEEVLRHHTKTRKALIGTFVTTYGLKNNMHSNRYIPFQVTMDDLFR